MSVEITRQVKIIIPPVPDVFNTEDGIKIHIESMDRRMLKAISREWFKNLLQLHEERMRRPKFTRPAPPPPKKS